MTRSALAIGPASLASKHAPGLQASTAAIGRALAQLFQDVGIHIEEREGRLIAVGISLKEPATALKALPRPGAVAKGTRTTH